MRIWLYYMVTTNL